MLHWQNPFLLLLILLHRYNLVKEKDLKDRNTLNYFDKSQMPKRFRNCFAFIIITIRQYLKS